VGAGRTWTPHNYGGKYYGEVTISTAVAKSLNSVAVKVLKEIGVGPVIRLISGASGADPSDLPHNLSLALGTAELSPVQLASSYAVFVDGGRSVRPYLLRAVEDREGRPVEAPRLSTGPLAGAPILSSAACATMISVMKGVLRSGGTAYEAARRTGFDVPAVGKTGTTNDYRDAWFAGATADFASAVWLGHDDMRIPLGPGRAGGTSAAPIWMRFVKEAYRTRPTRAVR
jgi:penicillin-binding protein 1A